MLACPAAVALAASAIGLAPGLYCAAMLVASSPVTLGGSVIAARFGLPARPMVWAAVMGIAFVPVTLPLMAALSGAQALPPPHRLAMESLWIAGLPLSAALLARRIAPHQIAARRPHLCGIVVLALAILACSAGGRVVTTLRIPGGWIGGATAFGVQLVCAFTAWVVGQAGRVLRAEWRAGLAPQLALAVVIRNTSIA